MMFTSTYTSKSMNACSASAHQAEAASVCAQASTARTQSAAAIARVLDTVMVPVSRICDHGEVWILLAAILLAIPKTRKLGTCVACGLALDLLFCNLALKPLIGRIRPFAVNPTVSLLIPPPTDASFPSGHTAASFASVAALKTANSRLWKPALALAVVIALSRLYLYAHWPTDILGGAAVGILAGWLGTKLAQSFPRKKV